MKHPDFISQTLDGKYRIERELGRGGMGTVYLATHLGTERPVAVKIIAPQFMERAEFVERFRREARAAGRLRHPNVVDVTDFGFSASTDGQVAYLVMEYLDGCTLGEILDEEKNLPVSWTLDILEQVCSAVQEAHDQGIIHRDLKPDNIWLEPNQRGGYTVKVLDFGIAKLEENTFEHQGRSIAPDHAHETYIEPARSTLSAWKIDGTLADESSLTVASEAATIAELAEPRTRAAEKGTVHVDPRDLESKTAILVEYDDSNVDQDTIGTRIGTVSKATDRENDGPKTTGQSLLDSPNTDGLTRVGAVLGTPLYMSPEQCRGEHLDPRSDVYSLGVIAYQMLSGRTPFSGDFKVVMDAHMTMHPPSLKAKKVRRKMKLAIHSALSKDPDQRPQTAEAFASVLRAREDGIFGLLRRALVIYSEHLPKFLLLTTLFELPVILLTLLQVTLSFLKVSNHLPGSIASIATGTTIILLSLASAFCATLIVGTIVWIVSQYLAVPLRPVRLRPAFVEVRKKWKRLSGTGVLTALGPFVISAVASIAGFLVFGFVGLIVSPLTGLGSVTLIIAAIGGTIGFLAGFFWSYVTFLLVSPVIMMEPVGIRQAFRRSRELTKRSFMTAVGAAIIMFLIPMVLAATVSLLVNVTSIAIDKKPASPPAAVVNGGNAVPAGTETSDKSGSAEEGGGFKVNVGPGGSVNVESDKSDMQSRVKHSVLESLVQLIWLPLQIFVLSFSAIIVTLLYLKTRLAGGESMNELIERFENDEGPRKKWQERVRQRLIQSGRIVSRS